MYKVTHALGVLALLACAAAAEAGAQCSEAREPQVQEARYELDLRVDYEAEMILGRVRLSVENVSGRPAGIVPLLLYRLMVVESVEDASGRELDFEQAVVSFEDFSKLQVDFVQVSLRDELAPGDSATIVIDYAGHLLGYAETGMLYVQDRVDPEFTIIRPDANAYPRVGVPCLGVLRAAALPSFDYLASISVPESLTVANGGELVETRRSNGTATYVYRNAWPAWRMDFAIADYGLLVSGAHRVYYLPGDSVGATRVVKALEASLELFKEWFGPLAEARGLTVIEIPDGWGSQKDETTIIQAAAAFRDPTRSREVYHEVSHFWNVPPLDNPSPRWNEGQASFLEYLAAEEIEGRDAVDQRFVGIVGWLRGRSGMSPELRDVPLIDYGKEQMTDYSYTAGMLLFAVIYELVGAADFNRIIGGFYEKYHVSGATTDDFVRYANSVTELDLGRFFSDWVYSTGWLELVTAHDTAAEMAAVYRGN